MNDLEQPTMTCDWCGKTFPADARACVESGIAAFLQPEDGEEWKGEQPSELPPGHFDLTDANRAQMKADLEIDDAQLDELLATGKVEGLGAIICVKCQDIAAENQSP